MSPEQARAKLWRIGSLTYKLHASQRVVYDKIKALPKKVREVLVFISRRWGKSYLGVQMAVEDCLRNPGVQVAIVGPNLRQTRNIIAPIMAKIKEDAPIGLITETKSELIWTVGKSTLRIAAFDTALESLRGLDLFAVYMEESGLSHPDEYEYIIKSVLKPTLMHSRGRIVHLTTPSRHVDHPLHTDTIPKCDVVGAFFKLTIRDNPLLTEEEIEEEIAEAGGIDSPHTQRELFCEIVRDTDSLLVPEFTEAEHVRDFSLPEYFNMWVGGDYGGSRDKTVLHLCAYDFDKGRVLFYDERAFENKTGNGFIVPAVKDMERPFLRKISHRRVDAPGQVQVDLANAPYHYEISIPDKTQDMEAGVRALRTAFQRGQIWVHPRCKLLIATLRSGMWNEKRTDFERTKALGHADAIASAVYAFRHKNTDNPYPKNHGFKADEMVRQRGEEGHALKALIPGFK